MWEENFLHGSFIMILMGHVLTHRRDSFQGTEQTPHEAFDSLCPTFSPASAKKPQGLFPFLFPPFLFFLVAIPIDIMTGITL